MSEVKQRGRRRASSSVTHELSSVPGSRREAIAAERANAPSSISVATLLRASAASGAGQKVGVAMAATGLVLAVTLPSNAPVDTTFQANAETASSVEATEAAVVAGAEVPITFASPNVGSVLNPDGQLKETLKVNAANVTPQSSKGTLSGPLENMVTSSPFGGRINPITGQAGEMHTGQDFAIQCGNNVLSAAGGVVTFAGWHQYGGGNRVVVDHGNGLSTSYNHMSSISVTVGQKLDRGGIVGLSGTTGASTGCHLHFEVMVDDATVDPMDWL